MLRRIFRACSHYGLRGALFRGRVAIADWWFDLKHGVNTRADISLDRLNTVGDNKSRGYRYEAARVLPVRMVFQAIKGMFQEPIALVDFGSGKGRILLLAAESGYFRATGVEFAPELCAIARSNCEAISRRRTVLTTLCVVPSDAVDYAVADDDNLFFFFNPFDAIVLEAVLANIARSFKTRRRRMILMFYNTDTAKLVACRTGFRQLQDFDYQGYVISLFECCE